MAWRRIAIVAIIVPSQRTAPSRQRCPAGLGGADTLTLVLERRALAAIQRAQRGQHRVDADDRAAFELTHCWHVWNRMGVRGPAGKNGTFLGNIHVAVVQHVVGMIQGARRTLTQAGPVPDTLGKISCFDHLRSSQFGLPAPCQEA